MTKYSKIHRQRGATLFVGMMFLLVLTLVALVAMRGTTLELKMATNQAQRQTAFQLSESMRVMAASIASQNMTSRGMQNFSGSASSWADLGSGGTVGGQPGGGTSCSSSSLPAAMELYQNESTTASQRWHTINGVFRNNVPTSAAADIAGNGDKLLSSCSNGPAGGSAWANVYSIGTRNQAGAGTAQNESATGSGAGAGGATRWFEIRSQAQVGTGAAVVTAGETRQPIRN